MANFIQRDQQRRLLFAKLEKRRMQLKSMRNNQNISIKAKWGIMQLLNTINRKSCFTRVQNRCVLSGRAHSVYRFSRLSRIKFKELACQGTLVGVSKSSW